MGNSAVERRAVGGWADLDSGQLDDAGAERGEARGERVGLLAGAGRHDAFAEQRQALEPVQLVAQADHFADDDGGRRLHSVEHAGQGSQRAHDGLLVRPGGPAHRHGGSVGRAAVRHQLAGDFGKRGESHENHQCLGVADFGPVDCLHGVPGDEGDGGGVLAMGERHAGVGGNAEGSGHAGHDFKGYAGIGQGLGFFAAAAEEEGVAALEAHHGQAAARALDEQAADFLLRECVRRFLFADVEAFGVGWGEREEGGVGQMVVENGVGLLEDAASLDGDEIGVAGSRADKVDLQRHEEGLSTQRRGDKRGEGVWR